MDKCPKCQTRLSWIAGEPAHPDNQYCDNCGWPHELAGEEAEKALENALPDTIQVSRAEYEALRRDAERLNFLESEMYDLRCISTPTGGDDYSEHWEVISFHMAEPRERTEGFGSTPRAALDAIVKPLKERIAELEMILRQDDPPNTYRILISRGDYHRLENVTDSRKPLVGDIVDEMIFDIDEATQQQPQQDKGGRAMSEFDEKACRKTCKALCLHDWPCVKRLIAIQNEREQQPTAESAARDMQQRAADEARKHGERGRLIADCILALPLNS